MGPRRSAPWKNPTRAGTLLPRTLLVRLLPALAAVLFIVLGTSTALAGDYDVESSAWNGLREFVSLAESEGIVLRPRSSLVLSDLKPADALIVVFPTEPLPASSLIAFVDAGGRLVVADDFGESSELLSHFGIRREPAPTAAARLRGNAELRVARPALSHSLTEGVDALLTNHAVALTHATIPPIFDFEGRGLVVTGVVGRGRLVAIGDPSLFINNMLELKGNRRFATNLLRSLQSDTGTIYLLHSNASLRGAFGDPSTLPPAQRARAVFEHLSTLDVPPIGVLWFAGMLLALFLVVSGSSLTAITPYRQSRLVPDPGTAGGFAARVAYHASSRHMLVHAGLSYRFELERALAERLGLRGAFHPDDAVRALREHGVAERDLGALSGALRTLDALVPSGGRAMRSPSLSRRKLCAIVELGERILSHLDAEVARA